MKSSLVPLLIGLAIGVAATLITQGMFALGGSGSADGEVPAPVGTADDPATEGPRLRPRPLLAAGRDRAQGAGARPRLRDSGGARDPVHALRRAARAGSSTGMRSAVARVGRDPVHLARLREVFTDERATHRERERSLHALADLDPAGAASTALAFLKRGGGADELLRGSLIALRALPRDGHAGAEPSVRTIALDTDQPEHLRTEAFVTWTRMGDGEGATAALRTMFVAGGPERELAIVVLRRASAHAGAVAVLQLEAMHAVPPLSQAVRNGIAHQLAVSKGRSWFPVQATGAPDAAGAGDMPTAWASKRGDMGEVTLDLMYAVAVRPEAVRIHEIFNPGAVVRVEAATAHGGWAVLWSGEASTHETHRWFEPELEQTTEFTTTIRLVLDTNRVSGWNEIDAVEMVGDGQSQWASSAVASSTYGSPH